MRVNKGEIYKQVQRGRGEGTIVKVTECSFGRVVFKVIEPHNLEGKWAGHVANQLTRRFIKWFSPVNRKIKRLE